MTNAYGIWKPTTGRNENGRVYIEERRADGSALVRYDCNTGTRSRQYVARQSDIHPDTWNIK